MPKSTDLMYRNPKIGLHPCSLLICPCLAQTVTLTVWFVVLMFCTNWRRYCTKAAFKINAEYLQHSQSLKTLTREMWYSSNTWHKHKLLQLNSMSISKLISTKFYSTVLSWFLWKKGGKHQAELSWLTILQPHSAYDPYAVYLSSRCSSSDICLQGSAASFVLKNKIFGHVENPWDAVFCILC